MKKSTIPLLILSFTLSNFIFAKNIDKQFLKEVMNVSAIYNQPFKDPVHQKEARRSQERVINNLKYDVVRYNHGLQHAVRQAYLAEKIISEMLKSDDLRNPLVNFLKGLDEEQLSSFEKKMKLLGLYYRAGRENEYSPSGGTEQEKARFNENMREGVKLFKEAAEKSELFNSTGEINNFAEALLHYQYRADEKEFTGITRFIDQIAYAAHILDLRRVNAPWNRPPEGPKEMLPLIGQILGFDGVNDTVNTLNRYSGKFLKATGDRDAWEGRGQLSDEFFFQAYDPEMMLIKLDRVNS